MYLSTQRSGFHILKLPMYNVKGTNSFYIVDALCDKRSMFDTN